MKKILAGILLLIVATAIPLNAQDIDQHLIIASEKSSSGDFAGAIDDYNLMLAKYPFYTSKILLFRANTYFRISKYKEAIMDYDKVIAWDSTLIEAYLYRGIAKMQLKDYQGALTDFNEVIALDPVFSSAYTDRGEANALLNKKDAACQDLEKALELGDASASILQKQYCNK